jgi:hypothetical protein
MDAPYKKTINGTQFTLKISHPVQGASYMWLGAYLGKDALEGRPVSGFDDMDDAKIGTMLGVVNDLNTKLRLGYNASLLPNPDHPNVYTVVGGDGEALPVEKIYKGIVGQLGGIARDAPELGFVSTQDKLAFYRSLWCKRVETSKQPQMIPRSGKGVLHQMADVVLRECNLDPQRDVSERRGGEAAQAEVAAAVEAIHARLDTFDWRAALSELRGVTEPRRKAVDLRTRLVDALLEGGVLPPGGIQDPEEWKQEIRQTFSAVLSNHLAFRLCKEAEALCQQRG